MLGILRIFTFRNKSKLNITRTYSNKRNCITRFILLISFILTSSFSIAQKEASRVDSIMQKLLNHYELYSKYIQSYEANVYLKGNSFVKKKNILSRFAPDFLYWDKKGNDNFMEAFIDVSFEAPNLYTQHIKAVNGNRLNINDIQNRVMQFLNINIYNPTIFDEQALLSGCQDIHEYYRFEYISERDTLGLTMHRIKIIPKVRSQKLIAGYIDIINDLWTVFSCDFSGKLGFFKYRVETEFGLPEKDFLLPRKTQISFQMDLLGNEVVNHYSSSYQYTSVTKYPDPEQKKKTNYDLSKYYSVHTDSIPIIRDSLFWDENRPIALDDYEKELFNSVLQKQRRIDTLIVNKPWDFSQGLIEPKKITNNNIFFTYSGLLNPLKLSYSKLDGIRYWQQFRLRKRFTNGEELRFNPNIGYLFKRKEFYFNLPAQWVFKPERFGELSFNFGNRNRTYSSAIIKQIENEIPDSVSFDDFDLEYYRHNNLNLMASYEISNGLLVKGGFNYDWYDPKKKEETKDDKLRNEQPSLLQIDDEDIIDLVSDQYRSFAPTIEIRYTPHQYYRINGKRKEYVGSRWPSFSINYGRGIKGILNSNSNYERIEADIQQKIPLGLLNSFQYYIGAGGFTNKESTYFADYKYFERHNFPRSWNDPIGGVFHLLDGNWYFSSTSYLQAHFMFESPFVLLRPFRWVSKDILTERFYLSQLHTPALPCYTEIGYSFGNFIGNIGFFASFNKGHYESFGVKASLELGK